MLIGLTGRAGVGKTTIANMLRDQKMFNVVAYATPLKVSLSALTGLDLDHFTNIALKEVPIYGLGKSPRELMQLMGTEFVREMVNEDFWIWRMDQTLSNYDLHEQHVVIDDCRFNNETQLVRDLGGIVVHLKRNFESPTAMTSHASERPVSKMSTDVFIDSGTQGEYLTFLDVTRSLFNCGVTV